MQISSTHYLSLLLISKGKLQIILGRSPNHFNNLLIFLDWEVIYIFILPEDENDSTKEATRKRFVLYHWDYHPFFSAEVAPWLTNHLCELPFSVWIQRLELVMLLSKEKVIATPIGFWIIGVSPSSISSPPLTRMATFGGVWYNGTVRVWNWGRRIWLLRMIKYSFKNLRAQFHRHQVTTIAFPFNCSNSWEAWSACTRWWEKVRKA